MLEGGSAPHGSPRRPRVLAGQALHLGEHVAEVLGVQALPAAAAADGADRRDRRAGSAWPGRCTSSSTRVDLVAQCSPGRRRRPPRPAGAPRPRSRNSSSRYGHTAFSAACMRPVRLVGAVAEPQRPAGGVVAVVGQLLDALAGHRGEHRVPGVEQPVQQRQPPGGEQQQPGDRPGEVQVGPAARPAPRCGTRARRAGRPGRPRPASGGPRRARPGPAAPGPGRAGRARCWPAPRPPPARGRCSPTPRVVASRSARRRRASGSRRPGRRGRRRRAPAR